MKKLKLLLSLSLLTCLLIVETKAQVFHGIIMADTYDLKIGESCDRDASMMLVEMQAIASANKMRFDKHFLVNANFTNKKIEKVLDELDCGPKDVVFFYYSGHGVRAKDEGSKWPQLALNDRNARKLEENFLSLAYIDEQIASKQPKFRIVMADCCNEIISGLSPKRTRSFTIVEQEEDLAHMVNVYQDLFKKPHGNVICTSSSPGEKALCDENGGFFTRFFLENLGDYVNGSQSISWFELLDKTKETTLALGEGSIKFTPQFEISMPEDSEVTTETDITPSEEIYNVDEDLITRINELISKPSMGERIASRSLVLDDVFASKDALVSVYGRDGKTLVDTYKAETYINLCATSSYLLKVVEIDSEKDEDGKLKALSVHEYRSKIGKD